MIFYNWQVSSKRTCPFHALIPQVRSMSFQSSQTNVARSLANLNNSSQISTNLIFSHGFVLELLVTNILHIQFPPPQTYKFLLKDYMGLSSKSITCLSRLSSSRTYVKKIKQPFSHYSFFFSIWYRFEQVAFPFKYFCWI